MSGHYDLREPGRFVVGTVYVYPVRFLEKADPPAEEVRMVKEVVLQRYSEAKTVEEGDVRLVQRERTHAGHKAKFTFSDGQFFQNTDLLGSDVYVFRQGDWFIKFRFTYPDGHRQNVQADIWELMQELEFPKAK